MKQLRYFARGLCVVMTVCVTAAYGSGKDKGACSQTATVLKHACDLDVGVTSGEANAVCLNISDADARAECLATAKQDSADASKTCGDVLAAREDLCDALGDGRYEPEFGGDFAGNFVNPLDIGHGVAVNQFFLLKTGTKRVYKDKFGPASERQTVTVTFTNKTKLIDGVTCLVVTDVVQQGGVTIEDTEDWFAQDVDGNVWYCGESSRQLQTFPGDHPQLAELVGIDGSWKAGRDGAKAGILMPGTPEVGRTGRLELKWDEAEDANEIISDTGSATTPGASCNHTCIVTRDFSPLDAGGGEENKYYAPGKGLILEVDIETGQRTELQP